MGIYDICEKGASVEGDPRSKNRLDKMCPIHKLLFNRLIVA
jgi:hypothetical protein